MGKLAIVVLGMLMFESAHASCSVSAEASEVLQSAASSSVVYADEAPVRKIQLGSGGASAGWKPK